ncbi:MAG: 50S ribosomal protein L15 [Candidatus Babeliales bacterium]
MLALDKLTKLVKKRKRVGRGGSRGGTSGKGHKGQKARSGSHGVGYGFEGGQMPLSRRLPKRGFNNVQFETAYAIINLEDLERHFNSGDEVTKDVLYGKGLISKRKSTKGQSATLVKLLGNGSISKQLMVHVDAVSKSAVQAVEKIGGKVHLLKEM